MFCVWWWNFEGIINPFELVQNGAVNVAALYSEQLAALVAGHYPAALINRKHATLLQHNNAPAAHTAALIKAKIKELPAIEFLPHLAYNWHCSCPAIRLSPVPLHGSLPSPQAGPSILWKSSWKTSVVESFASKPAEWYRHGIK